jgi:hypothetical protein
MRTTYTTKSGVRIGYLYQHPPRREFSRDEERIQAAFLAKPQEKSGSVVALLISAASIAAVAIVVTL